MAETVTNEAKSTSGTPFKPLRVWIPIILLPLMYLARRIPDWVEDGPSNIWMVSAFGPALISLVVLGWWVIASRARWSERMVGLFGVLGILIVEQVLCHNSLRGPLLIVMTLPMAVVGFSLGVILQRNELSSARTKVGLLFAALAACFSLGVKSDGVLGDFSFDVRPRWQKSVEEKLALQVAVASEVKEIPSTEFDVSPWPAFRGAKSDGAQHGSKFDADWTANPPKELWRIEIGSAWSSFVATDKYLFTQEQRGENECLVCYDAATGKQVWQYNTPSRFFEALGGLGPRATPTLDKSQIYAMGAEGWLTKLDATNGKLVWKVDIRELTYKKDPPMWGFSSSPLVTGGNVVVHVGAPADKGIVAVSAEDGKLVWSSAAGEHSYATPQLIKLVDRDLIALLSNEGAHLYDPKDGTEVFKYEWSHDGYRALQPQVIDGDKLLIATGMGTGTRLVKFQVDESGKFTTEDLWTCKDFKPDFNDFVIFENHIYGFDNRIFACVDLATGKRKWKGGRYEKGQAMLLGDSGLIVVVGEHGELALLRATPEKHEELAKFQALNDKTWNHPMIIGDKLYLRNAKEAVCYQLKTSQ